MPPQRQNKERDAKIMEMLSMGVTMAGVAAAFGITAKRVFDIKNRKAADFGGFGTIEERNAEIVRLYEVERLSKAALGQRFNLSHQRVDQIICGINPTLVARERAAKSLAAKRAASRSVVVPAISIEEEPRSLAKRPACVPTVFVHRRAEIPFETRITNLNTVDRARRMVLASGLMQETIDAVVSSLTFMEALWEHCETTYAAFDVAHADPGARAADERRWHWERDIRATIVLGVSNLGMVAGGGGS